jgi:putative DNA primase/helicase
MSATDNPARPKNLIADAIDAAEDFHNPLDLRDASDLTEDAIARVFAENYRDKLRFCHHTGAWFRWTGIRWQRDETKLAFHWARIECRQFIGKSTTSGKPATLAKATTAAAVERFAQADPIFAVTSEVWDRNPFLLGTPAGTVDLQTGELRAADPSDYITRLTAVAPAETPCPLWDQFLQDATNGDAGSIRFLRQWCGYSLTGSTREHALLFIYGPGGNGKSVFLNTVFGILGQYAAVAAMDTFTATRNAQHLAFLAMLAGARLVSCSETAEGRAWDEIKIKQLTGGDLVTANFMRQNPFTFQPQFKLTITGNHQPVLRDVDDAMRRRFNVVPFTFIPTDPDRELEVRLRAEWPGILRWMIEGCLDWQTNGLMRPQVVLEATTEYFSMQDIFAQWIEDCCEMGDGCTDTTVNLFSSWSDYALKRGEEVGSLKRLNRQLQRKGCMPMAEVPGHRKQRGLKGIRVMASRSEDETP